MRHLYNWLLSFFLGPMLFFASGAAAITEGVTEVEEGGEESAETTEGGEGGEEVVETTEGEVVEGEEEGGKGSEKDSKVDWRTVPQEVKAHIQEIGKTNAKLGNLLQNAVYTSQTFLKEFPGGLKEAQGLKKTIDEAGGVEEITNLRTTFRAMEDEQTALDNKARSGDPAVLDFLTETAGKEGFSKLMPHAMDKWLNQDPEMYSHVIGKIMVQALTEGGIVAELNSASRMLGLNNPEATKIAMESFKKVADWANKIGEIASKAPEKEKIDPQIARQRGEIEADKTKLFNDKFVQNFEPWRTAVIRDNLKRIAPKSQFSDFQLRAINRDVVNEVQIILTSDKEYLRNLERLYEAKNMPELLKFCRSRVEKLIPEQTKKVYRRLFSNTVLGKNKVMAKGAADKNKEGANKAGDKDKPQGAQGWTKVAVDKAPKPDEIDNSKTDFGMKFKKQAILKSGKKVYWGDSVPK